jgi:hypothetical protein
VSPARRRRPVEHLQRVFGMSRRWACRLVGTTQHPASPAGGAGAGPGAARPTPPAQPDPSPLGPSPRPRRAARAGWQGTRKAVQRRWREGAYACLPSAATPATRQLQLPGGSAGRRASRACVGGGLSGRPEARWQDPGAAQRRGRAPREALAITVGRRIDADATVALNLARARAGSRRTRRFHARGSAAHPESSGWHAPPPRRPASRTPVRSPRRGSSGPPLPSQGP